MFPTSFSQCNEDLYLYLNYFIHLPLTNPSFFEAGAMDGIKYSNSLFFEKYLSWNGILVEPNPTQFNLLLSNRPKNHLVNSIISNSTNKLLYEYSDSIHSAVSGVVDTLPDSHYSTYFNHIPTKKIYLQPISLTNILKKSPFQNITFFSLDVEGHELNVLQSFDFNFPIYLILLENLNSNDSNPCKDLLTQNGFSFIEKIGVNEIYINHLHYLFFHNHKPFYTFRI